MLGFACNSAAVVCATLVCVRFSDSNFSSFMSSFTPADVTAVLERSRNLRLEKFAIACIPLSVTLVRASSASTIRLATGASCAKLASVQRSGALTVRRINPSVGFCERGTRRTPREVSSVVISFNCGR